ncbi:hypothetical protein BRC62_07725 [Halobacteriales archaeon QH_10_67_13]|nr:MAG: hypothetical protein BRC62_07725 [Halobacteriales archaeon QH_10_67_13]
MSPGETLMSAGPSTSDRIRLFLSDHGLAVLAAFVLLAGAGGWLVYTAQPGTETETVVTDRWNEQGEFTHGAEITEPNPVFETGTVVERDVYFTRLSPVLEGSYRYQHNDDASRAVAMDLRLVLQSTQDETVIWQRTEPLNAADRTVDGGETVTAAWSVNISATEAQIERIEEQLGASIGTPEMSVVAEVVTTAEDGRATRHTQRFEIDPSGESFSVSPPEAYRESYETTAERTVETGLSLPRALAGALLVVTGVSGVVGLGIARRRDGIGVSPAEQRRLAHARERTEFDDWITTARVPVTSSDRPVVNVETLEGLVDTAIDTNRRVIEDAATGTLWVWTETTTYRHDPEEAGRAEDTQRDGADGAISLDAVVPGRAETPSSNDGEATDRSESGEAGGSEQTNGTETREWFPD